MTGCQDPRASRNKHLGHHTRPKKKTKPTSLGIHLEQKEPRIEEEDS